MLWTQAVKRAGGAVKQGKILEAMIPNPKLTLLHQVREVMRLKHYSIRTEHCYCDSYR